MLADTGSWYVALPRGVADKLRLRVIGMESVTLADGREAKVELAPVYIELLGLVMDPKSGEIRQRGPRSSYMLSNLYQEQVCKHNIALN